MYVDWLSLPVRLVWVLVLYVSLCHTYDGDSTTYRTSFQPTDSDTSSATTSFFRRQPPIDDLSSIGVPFPFHRRLITQPPTTIWNELSTTPPPTEIPKTTQKLRIKLRKRVKIRRPSQFVTTTTVPLTSDVFYQPTTTPSTFGTRILPMVTQRGQTGLRDVSTTTTPMPILATSADPKHITRAVTSLKPTPNPFIPPTTTNKAGTTVTNKTNKTKSDKDDDDDETKSLAMEVEAENGKYGLIQQLFPSASKRPPGIISYKENEETPNDVASNLGGVNPDDVWLSEGSLLVLKGGTFPSNYQSQNGVWLPLDNYEAPKMQVKVPIRPKVPPPFPININKNGPPMFLGRPPPFFYPPFGNDNETDGRPSFLPPPPGFYIPPPFGNFSGPPPFSFPPGNDHFRPGTDRFPPGTNRYPPGSDRYPPGNGRYPPGNGRYPPGNDRYPPSNDRFPPGSDRFPPGIGNFRPGNGNFPPGNGRYPLGNGNFPPGNGRFPPGNRPPFPFPPTGGNNSFPPLFNGSAPTEPLELPPSKDNLTDDPSVLYPPPYDFFYPMDNSTPVPPGPFAPGLIVPPPPDFFMVVNDTKLFPPGDSSEEDNSSYNEDYSYNNSESEEEDGINSLGRPTPIPPFRKTIRPDTPLVTQPPVYTLDQLSVTPTPGMKQTYPVKPERPTPQSPFYTPQLTTSIPPLNVLYEDYIRRTPKLDGIYRSPKPFKLTPKPKVTTTTVPFGYTRGKNVQAIVFPGPTNAPVRNPHKLYNYLTGPTPPTSTVIPLDGDTLVNQRPPVPGINPDSEPIPKPKAQGYYVLIPNQPNGSDNVQTATLYYVIPENNKVFLYQPPQSQLPTQISLNNQHTDSKSPVYYITSDAQVNNNPDNVQFPGPTNTDQYSIIPQNQQQAYPSTENPSYFPSPHQQQFYNDKSAFHTQALYQQGYQQQRDQEVYQQVPKEYPQQNQEQLYRQPKPHQLQQEQPNYYYYPQSTPKPYQYQQSAQPSTLSYGQRAGPSPADSQASTGHVAFHRSGPGGYNFQIAF